MDSYYSCIYRPSLSLAMSEQPDGVAQHGRDRTRMIKVRGWGIASDDICVMIILEMQINPCNMHCCFNYASTVGKWGLPKSGLQVDNTTDKNVCNYGSSNFEAF